MRRSGPVTPACVAVGTLACPGCDAPVSPGDRPLRLTDAVECPYCGRFGRVRDFLSLATPTRPARVEIRLRGFNFPRGSWSRA